MKKSIQLAVSIWLVLCYIALPISYRFLPDLGEWISTLLFPINHWLCDTIFYVDITNTFLLSDSIGFYTTSAILLVCAILCGVFIHNQIRLKDGIRRLSYFILVYWLSYFLLRYGFDKIIGIQFYFPAPNTLHTPLGYFSKDILYWSTMGTSSFYNYFMAGIEVFTGCLLLWRKTRFVGLICAFAILSNILATNIGFDISVKYLSGLLLITNIFLLTYYVNQFKTLFGSLQDKTDTIPHFFLKKSWKIGLKATIIFIFIAETILYGILNPPFFRVKEKSYVVSGIKGESTIFNLIDLKRIHFHREGYLILENTNNEFLSFSIVPFPSGFKLNNLYFKIDSLEKTITWKENQFTNELHLQEIDLSQMPISTDESHWYLEKMIDQ